MRTSRAGVRTLPKVIFKAVGDGRPYPDHGYSTARQWSQIVPSQVRLEDLVTTRRTLDLAELLSEDSTFYGDLFAHVVLWRGTLYLEDGLHRAVRAALAQRQTLHARVLTVPDVTIADAPVSDAAVRDVAVRDAVVPVAAAERTADTAAGDPPDTGADRGN